MVFPSFLRSPTSSLSSSCCDEASVPRRQLVWPIFLRCVMQCSWLVTILISFGSRPSTRYCMSELFFCFPFASFGVIYPVLFLFIGLARIVFCIAFECSATVLILSEACTVSFSRFTVSFGFASFIIFHVYSVDVSFTSDLVLPLRLKNESEHLAFCRPCHLFVFLRSGPGS